MTEPKRPAHRPTSDNPATLLITIKATPEQKSKFLELGGSRWVKRLINEAIDDDRVRGLSEYYKVPYVSRLGGYQPIDRGEHSELKPPPKKP